MASAKMFDTYVDGLDDILRAFRKLPKEASAELRTASVSIAERHMVPAWRDAALNYAGPWGEKIAESVRAKRDRVPSVNIGGNRKVFSGGASATMVRYPSDAGQVRPSIPPAFTGTDWIGRARGYEPAAIREWAAAVDQVLAKWPVM